MRRIELQPTEPFRPSFINRTGAFNADALMAATRIVQDVREHGDDELRALTEKFDGVKVDSFRVPDEAFDRAFDEVNPETLEALQHAAAQIREFHQRQVQQSWMFAREDGAIVGAKVTPIDSVGIYVPGGRALYPSSVLMNSIPASVAGVGRIACVTPPAKDGSVDAAILVACKLGGVDEVYTVGGAQAIAALAYGTESIPAVDKVTGPGNAYVAAAKKVVSGDVGIDMIAGPSEVCVVADGSADRQPGGHRPHGAGRARPAGGMLSGVREQRIRRRRRSRHRRARRALAPRRDHHRLAGGTGSDSGRERHGPGHPDRERDSA